MKTIEELGPEIRRLRVAEGLTQKEAAQRARVGASRWSAWERGERVPRRSNLRKIAGAVPLELAVWEPVVAEYHKQLRRKAKQNLGGSQPEREYAEVAAMMRDKPRRKGLKAKVSPIGEIARAARAEGLTYGEYVAKRDL